MSYKKRFEDKEVPKENPKPVPTISKVAPLPTATQRDFEQLQKKKDAEKALKLVEEKISEISEPELEKPQDNQPFTLDQPKDQQNNEKPDLTQKIYDQRRPLDDQTTSQPQTGRPVVDQQKLVVQSKLVDQKEAGYPTRFERDKIGLRLPKDKVTQYKMWCFLNGISLQDAVEKAMDRLLVDQPLLDDQQKLVDQTTRRPHDLDIRRSDLDKDHPDPDNLSYTIELYKKWTGNNFNSYDFQIYEEQIKDVSKEDIRLGIMASVAGCKTTVGTFKYCIKAIKQSTTIKNKIIQEQQILELLQKRGITIK